VVVNRVLPARFSPEDGLALAAAPDDPAIRSARWFHARAQRSASSSRGCAELDRAGMHRAGVIVDRVHPFDPTDLNVAGTAARLAPVLGPSLAERTARTHAEVQRLAQRDAAAIARLRSALKSEPVALAERPSDVHDIPGLMALREELFERDDEHESQRHMAPVGSGDSENPRLHDG
jgi:hypothetical protein